MDQWFHAPYAGIEDSYCHPSGAWVVRHLSPLWVAFKNESDRSPVGRFRDFTEACRAALGT
jgi:hypothetical protein